MDVGTVGTVVGTVQYSVLASAEQELQGLGKGSSLAPKLGHGDSQRQRQREAGPQAQTIGGKVNQYKRLGKPLENVAASLPFPFPFPFPFANSIIFSCRMDFLEQ